MVSGMAVRFEVTEDVPESLERERPQVSATILASGHGRTALRRDAHAARSLRVRRHLLSLAIAVGPSDSPDARQSPFRGEGLSQRGQPGPLRVGRDAASHDGGRAGAGQAPRPGQHVREPAGLRPRRRSGRRRLEGDRASRPAHDAELRDRTQPEHPRGPGLRPPHGPAGRSALPARSRHQRLAALELRGDEAGRLYRAGRLQRPGGVLRSADQRQSGHGAA